MRRHLLRSIALSLAFAGSLAVAQAASAATISAGVVFGANAEGNTWPGWTWNTLGRGDSTPWDTYDIWNLYWSTTTAPDPPTFLNTHNDARTNISIPLAPGTYTYGLYGNSTGQSVHEAQHFVLSLYFDGATGSPGISALTGPSCALCPAGHPNSTNLFGATGTQAANTLTWTDGVVRVTLTGFSWALSDLNRVHSHYHHVPDYPTFDSRPDFVGTLTFRVEQVPEPALLALLGIAVPVAARRLRRRR